MHNENSFITLTYNSESLPPFPHSLIKEHHREFIKNIRKYYYPKTIRYYLGGEYGTPTFENDFIARPHVHVLLFGHQFTDLVLYEENEGIKTYTSAIADEIWGKGETKIGNVSFQSAGYVARYCFKKVIGDRANEHYERICPTSLSVQNVIPEYGAMSLRPGIGKTWYDKYKTDVFPADRVVLQTGQQIKTPRYYDILLERENPDLFQEIKAKRITEASLNTDDSTRKRLANRQEVKHAQIGQLNRKL